MLEPEIFQRRQSRPASNFGILLLSISFMTGFITYAGTILKLGGGPYQTSDWLINYEGGFVRRGLVGQLILNLAPNSVIGLGSLLIVQSLLFLIVFIFFAWILYRSNSSWFLTILICSPAGIVFSGWDVAGFGRKEIIGYVVFILLFFQIRQRNRVNSRLLIWSAFSLYIFGILSWEPLALLLPTVILMLRCGMNSSSKKVESYITQAIFIFSTGLIFFLSMKYKGSQSQAAMICDAVRAKGYTGEFLCSGANGSVGYSAIDAIGWSSSFTLQQVRESFPLYFWYLPLFSLALFPLIKSKILVGLEKNSIVIFLSLAPLYLIVTDYGRWFSMFYISVLFVLLSLKNISKLELNESLSRPFGIVFLLAWGIPHWVRPGTSFPVNGAIITPIKILLHYSLAFRVVYASLLTLIICLFLFVSFRRRQNRFP
jgi:hypothetical protein